MKPNWVLPEGQRRKRNSSTNSSGSELISLQVSEDTVGGEHITDIYITETGTTELENLSHNIIDIFLTET